MKICHGAELVDWFGFILALGEKKMVFWLKISGSGAKKRSHQKNLFCCETAKNMFLSLVSKLSAAELQTSRFSRHLVKKYLVLFPRIKLEETKLVNVYKSYQKHPDCRYKHSRELTRHCTKCLVLFPRTRLETS